MERFQEVGKGLIKRKNKRVLGVFIDGIGLDRATRRIKRKVQMSKLIQGVASGLTPIVARYYTLLPSEDDSRHHAYLDALVQAGIEVVVKRLPPKGVNKQASISVEMSADIIAFAMGHNNFGDLSLYKLDYARENSKEKQETEKKAEGERIVTVICPDRDLNYAISFARDLKVDTVTADFGKFSGYDVLKSSAKWIDLSDSETIWRE